MLKNTFGNYEQIAGADEVGRGCIAGPVVAAAVILDKSLKIDGLNDSKLLSSFQREDLSAKIKESALAYSIQFIDNNIIDEVNILNASFQAMEKALLQLSSQPDIALIDGHLFRTERIDNYECIVKGDTKYQQIAAASILAKVARDQYMDQLSHKYTQYSWQSNKGYPTKAHVQAIKAHGFTPYHRKSFKLKALQLNLHLPTKNPGH